MQTSSVSFGSTTATSSGLLRPHDIAERVRGLFLDTNDIRERVNYYRQVEPALDRACALIIARAFARLGRPLSAGDRIDAECLFPEIGVVGRTESRRIHRLLTILEANGFARRMSVGWCIDQSIDTTDDVAEVIEPLIQRFPLYTPELELLSRFGERLSDMIRGEFEPLQLIFPDGSLSVAERIYGGSRSFSIYNAIAREAVRAVVHALPAKATLRILEVGAGVGCLTAEILDVLRHDQTQYVFTDISPMFTRNAARKFAHYRFLEYGTLDLDKSPEKQGFEPNSFDLVLAADVLHCTRDLRRSLGYVEKLLAPGGLLIALEPTKPPFWFDLVFGMLPGWWQFDDEDVRPNHSCIPGVAWRGLAAETGFPEIELLADENEVGETVHSVLVAQCAHTAERRADGNDNLALRPSARVAPCPTETQIASAANLKVPIEADQVRAMSGLERELTNIWEEILDVSPLGLHDNFFDLGDSLLALRMFSKIRARLGRTLPLITLFRAPTIERLAEAIERSEPALPWSPLVPIGQSTGAGEAPLFTIHGLTGEIMNLHALAVRLAANRPVYAIRARGLDGGPPPLDRIEDMADYYLEHLRGVQPQGPYRLLGFCFGGLVAFEMARRLSAAGETVAFLGLLDSAFHQRLLPPASRLRFELAKLRIHIETLRRLPRGERLADRGSRLAYLRARLVARRSAATLSGNSAAEMPYLAYLPNAADAPDDLRDVTIAAARAFCHYEPGLYSGSLTYIRPKIRDFRNILNFAPEWRRKATGGVDTIFVPGDHMTMLHSSCVDVLAERLDTLLQTADAGPS